MALTYHIQKTENGCFGVYEQEDGPNGYFYKVAECDTADEAELKAVCMEERAAEEEHIRSIKLAEFRKNRCWCDCHCAVDGGDLDGLHCEACPL